MENIQKQKIHIGEYGTIIFMALLLIGLYWTRIYSYLLFHSIAEFFSIVVACGIFMFAYNSKKISVNNYLLFIGIAYLFIGILDMGHLLTYKGMGVVKGDGANLPTQLWIAARYTESISLLIAPFFLERKMNSKAIFSIYFFTTTVLMASIFWNIFPICFIEGSGLTPFKRLSEYLISLILVGSIVFMSFHRPKFNKHIFRLLVISIILTIGAELTFTLYVSVYGFSNLVGHYLKIISFYLIYKAIIEAGLKKPYSLLFKNLKQNEDELRKEHNKLRDTLEQVKILSGLLPICANCKKIRDDKGYWNQIESYIRDHSDAEFTHGICPECMKELYPDIIKTTNTML